MAKQSAGILLYRQSARGLEVLLAHPGGPFWAKKDRGVWSIPKGEFTDEDALTAAKREFLEECGQTPPTGDYYELGSVKMSSGKVIYAWAVLGDFNVDELHSNTFSMEWPPKSGEQQEFPEIDTVRWLPILKAYDKLLPSQTPFLDRLADHLGVETKPPEQASLF